MDHLDAQNMQANCEGIILGEGIAMMGPLRSSKMDRIILALTRAWNHPKGRRRTRHLGCDGMAVDAAARVSGWPTAAPTASTRSRGREHAQACPLTGSDDAVQFFCREAPR